MNDIVAISHKDPLHRHRKSNSLLTRIWQWGGTALFWVLTLGIALASWRFIVWGVDASMAHVAYHAHLRPVALYTHIIFAPLALALVPFQLWQGLRKQRPSVHRILGRTYAISILLSGLSGLWLAATVAGGALTAWGFGLLAIAWLSTTGMGVGLAMRRNFAGHRRWIIRSVAVTLSAVTLRLYLIPTEVLEVSSEATYAVIAWMCWVPNLLVAELYLRWPRKRPEPTHLVTKPLDPDLLVEQSGEAVQILLPARLPANAVKTATLMRPRPIKCDERC